MKHFYTAMNSFVGISLLYLLLILILPANRTVLSLYSLTAMQYHILLFFIALPLTLIWFTAFYGSGRLREFAGIIANTGEGEQYGQIARGLQWIAWGLVVPSFVSIILNTIANSYPGFHDSAVIITSYSRLIFPLVGFTFISNGSRGLAEHNHARISITGARWLILSFVSLGVLFCYLIFRTLDLQSLTSTNNQFFLPTWLVIISIVIPYLYAWFVGLLAAYEIFIVSVNTRGLLYRRALYMLALGLGGVIAGSSAVQYLQSVAPRTGRLSLGPTLLLIYLILIMIGISFFIVASGARKLRRIEEV